MNKFLLDILYIVISAAITIGGAIAVRMIMTKTNWKYKDEIAAAVTTAVSYVQQTFVDGKKDRFKFGDEEQQKARNMAIDTAYSLMSVGAKEYLCRERSDKEADEYLTVLIEDAVRNQKKEG